MPSRLLTESRVITARQVWMRLLSFWSSSVPVSPRLRSRIWAPAFSQFGGCCGWRLFPYSRSRRESVIAQLFCSVRSRGSFGEMNQWNYVRHEIKLPWQIMILYFVVPAAVFGLGVLFVRSFLRGGLLFLAALAFPVYWVAYEYLTAIASSHSTWGNLAYTQMNCLPVIQIASIIGIWGISFIVFLFAGTIASLLSGIGNPRQRGALAVTIGIVVCAFFLFGEWRLRSNPSAESVAVTLIAKDVPMSVYLGNEEQALALLREYAGEVRRVTPTGREAVVLQEKIARVSENALAEVDALFSATAADTRAAIVLGLVRRTPFGAFNSSRFYSADGKFEANYDKHHLVPGVEPEKPGNKRVLLDQVSGRWGLQICKDMDFPKLSRKYAAEGATLLLLPAWDFNLDRC